MIYEPATISTTLYTLILSLHLISVNTFYSLKEVIIFCVAQQARRRFTRATSVCVLSLLDYLLGACVFVNCKSGIDRTGIYVAVATAVICLWELYPQRRWNLHLALINYNILRGTS
jgi:hypothetical protein